VNPAAARTLLENDMARLGEISRLTAKPGRRDDLLALLATTLPDKRETEPGTEQVFYLADVDDEVTVWIYTLFTDDAARAFHRSKVAARDALRERITPLVEHATEQHVGTVEHSKVS
jgi:quinol monooxygenase YgiN